MKYSYPKKIAIYLGVIIALIAGSFQLIGVNYDATHKLLLAFLMMMVIFLIVYVIVYYTLNNYIIQKIKPIYKTIRNIDVTDEELYAGVENSDVISEVNSNVLNWALREKQHITELKEQSKFRKEFIGNVSHELKTPIFNIQGYVSTLLDGGLEDASINRTYLERAEKNINRIISIVDDLTIISKLESGELKLEFEKFNIIKLADEIIDLYEMKAGEHKVSLKIASGIPKNIMVLADRRGISQVLSNLVENSIKYGKEGGSTTIDFYDMDKNILVEVVDNGIGIEEKFLARIFERFYRIDKHRSREQGGSGLGLSIVKHVLDAHNQQLNVRSQVGKGTTFAFTLKKAK